MSVPGSSTFGTVASLKLTKGAWVVVAKGFLSNDSSSAAVAACVLVAGTDSNRFKSSPVSGGSSGSRASFLLTVGHAFASAGSANLRCESTAGTGDVKANLLRMTAIQAGTLTDKTIGGSTHTSGSGIPLVVTAHATAPVDLSGGTLGTVASVQLPEGPWFVMADLWARDTLSTGAVDGFELATVHTFSSPGAVTLLSGDTASTGQVEIQFVKITAIKAGSLSTEGL
ncbi:MAG: hypothetical protein ACJ77A_11055 [Actinomycetota bacterium]